MEEKRDERSLLEQLAQPDQEQKQLPQAGSEAPLQPENSSKQKRIVIALLAVFSGLIAISLLAELKPSENQKENHADTDSNDLFESFARERLSGSLRSAMNQDKRREISEQNGKQEETKRKKNQASGGGKNQKKDEEILLKYAEMSDAAADSPVQKNEAQPSARSARRSFLPGSGEEMKRHGGITIKGSGSAESNERNKLDMHDTRVKVRLDFSILSTAPSTVVATVIEENEAIPANSKFYGKAVRFINKRTQISFSELLIGSKKVNVKGFAVSGKDPGVESEITDIASQNINLSVRQGAARTLANTALNIASAIGGGVADAAGNTVNPAASELNRQEEANRMTQEYRVPAGKTFFVYLE